MRISSGTVISGKIVPSGPGLVDGTEVLIVSSDGGNDERPSPAELAELEEGLAEADRGELVPGKDVFASLRRFGWADLQAALALLVLRPELGATVEEASKPGIRPFYVDRIRYWVYYRSTQSRLEVLSVWHVSQGAGPGL